MDAPKQPALADFGIAEKDVTRLPRLFFGPAHDGPLRMTLCFVTAILFPYILTSRFWGGDWKALLFFGPIWFLMGAGLAHACWAVLGFIENKIRMTISPAFRQASQYHSAMDVYRNKVAEYKQWVAAQEREYWRRQETFWRGLSGVAFENELACLFRRLGYKTTQTPRTSDGGVDLILRKDDRITVVQCKAHDKKIPIGVARELVASIQDFNAHDAIIACLEGVTKPVQQYIETKPIRVIDVHGILSLQKGISSG